jgi:L-2-hydroxycarboxylate dehydrogenase (NAD+)
MASTVAQETKAPQARYDGERLTRFVAGVFASVGMPDGLADLNARILVDADIRGIDSHGVPRLTGYINAIKAGRIDPAATPTIAHETAATARVDGHNGFGLGNAYWAMELAIQKAKNAGVGFVALAHTNHFGAASYYPLQALPHNLIGIAMTNAGGLVIPTFAREPLLGTNPLAVAVPGGKERPFVLDMACSTVAWGKVEIAQREEKLIPLGWAVDAEGDPTQDPFAARYLLPLGSDRATGSQKGYGLAMVVEVLCAPLSGAALGFDQRTYRPGPGQVQAKPSNIGQFFGAWDPAAFRPLDEFQADVDRLFSTLRAAAPAEGHDRVYIPGDFEYAAEEDRRQHGIPLHPKVVADLEKLGKASGVRFDARKEEVRSEK